MKIVLNKCRGAFDLSELAIAHYAKRKGIALFLVRGHEKVLGKVYKQNFYFTKAKEKRLNDKDGLWSVRDIKRNDPILIDVVSELGNKANVSYSRLVIEEIADGKKCKIKANDGCEFIEEIV